MTLGHWRLGVTGALQTERTIFIFYQPGPTGTKGSDSFFGELLFEFIKRPKSFINRFCQLPSRNPTAFGLEAIPVKGVVPYLGPRY